MLPLDIPLTHVHTHTTIQLLPRSLLQFCHTHVGHRNSERNRDRDIKESLLGGGSCIIFMSHSLHNEIDCDMHVNCSLVLCTVKQNWVLLTGN